MKTQEENEGRFKALHDASFGGIVIHKGGIILECNEVLEALTGYSREELIGTNGVLLFAEESRELIIDNIQNGYKKPYDAIGVHKSGRKFHVHIQGKDVTYKGEIVRAVEVRDITEQINIETELRESEERFRALHEASSGGIAIHEKGFILDCNEGLSKMFGYTREELIGMNGLLLIAESSRDNVMEKIKTGYEEPYEALGIKKDGVTFPIRIEARNVPYKGRRVRTVEFRDLTNRKRAEKALRESEAMFRSLAESFPDIIARYNTEYECLYINSAVTRIFSLQPKDLIRTSLYNSLLPKEVVKEWIRMISYVFEHGVNFQQEMLLGEQWVDVLVIPEYTQSHELTSVILTSRDITERKRLEAERDLIDKMESLSAVSAGIAHDLNNFLFAALGNIEFAIWEADKNIRDEVLSVAHEAAKKASNLSYQLLMFSKGEVLSKNVHEVRPILEGAVRFALGKGTEHTGKIICEENLPRINVDLALFARVLNNLIINAKQAMHTRGIVRIVAERVVNPEVAKGEFVKVSIEDTGPGIPRKHLDKIFNPFFTTKKSSGGSGLGLSVCLSIMQQHDGFITVHSNLGEGTIFSLYLPAVYTEIENESEKTPQSPHQTRNLHVLVLDDEESLRDVLSRMLEVLGHTFVVSSHGQEAVNFYQQALTTGNRFDLVILDLTIPGGMSGVDALEHILALDPHVCAVLSTGYTNKAPEHGFAGVLHKPYTLEELATVINKLF